jgi:hypothetical protein
VERVRRSRIAAGLSLVAIGIYQLTIAAEKAFRWGGGLAAAAGVGLIGWGSVGLLL